MLSLALGAGAGSLHAAGVIAAVAELDPLQAPRDVGDAVLEVEPVDGESDDFALSFAGEEGGGEAGEEWVLGVGAQEVPHLVSGEGGLVDVGQGRLLRDARDVAVDLAVGVGLPER